jgi:hypothetical protein
MNGHPLKQKPWTKRETHQRQAQYESNMMPVSQCLSTWELGHVCVHPRPNPWFLDTQTSGFLYLLCWKERTSCVVSLSLSLSPPSRIEKANLVTEDRERRSHYSYILFNNRPLYSWKWTYFIPSITHYTVDPSFKFMGKIGPLSMILKGKTFKVEINGLISFNR